MLHIKEIFFKIFAPLSVVLEHNLLMSKSHSEFFSKNLLNILCCIVSFKVVINFSSLVNYFEFQLPTFRFSVISDCIIDSIFFSSLVKVSCIVHLLLERWSGLTDHLLIYILSVILRTFCGRFFLCIFRYNASNNCLFVAVDLSERYMLLRALEYKGQPNPFLKVMKEVVTGDVPSFTLLS